MAKKSILVLATYDEHGQGHGWSMYKLFESLGFDAEFVCLIREHQETEKYIIDATNKKSWRYKYFNYLRFLGFLMYPFHGNMRWFYKGYSFASAKEVLAKVDNKKPDYILLCHYLYFMTPKNIYKLWKRLGGEMIIIMVDPQILGGGCNFPVGCNKGYEKSCNPCPLYPYFRFIPKYVFAQKQKYFGKMFFRLAGSKYDLNKAENVSFLKDNPKHPIISVPIIPFVKTKEEARKQLRLNYDDFVILAGAVNIKNPSKGFKELVESIGLFSKKMKTGERVTLLLPGKIMGKLIFPENINVITPGYLSLEDLYTAFYACDVLVSPSIEDSGPMMVNYAMVCGRPVVAFPVGCALDLVKHKETGWMAGMKNTEEYAEGINWAYTRTKEELQQIGNNCRNHINSFNEHPWYEFMQD